MNKSSSSKMMARGALIALMIFAVVFAYAGLMPARGIANAEGDNDKYLGMDPKLYEVMQVLVNYKLIKGNSLYADHADLYNKDITDPEVFPDVANYTKDDITSEDLEAYNDEVNLSPYDNITSLKGLSNATSLKKLVLPKSLASKKDESVKLPYLEIEAKTCFRMTNLETVIMPDTVTSIGANAFDRCTALENINVYKTKDDDNNDINYAGEYGDAANEGLDLKNVIHIGDSAFASCSAVTKAQLLYSEDDEIDIEANAFLSCSSLSEIYVPYGSLGSGVFKGCSSLSKITFEDDYTTIPNNTLEGVAPEGGIDIDFPDRLEVIEAYAFAGSIIDDTNLSECENLKEIKDYAFQNAALRDGKCDLGGTALESIGEESFEGVLFAGGNGEVILPDSLTEMGTAAFAMTSGLTSVQLSTELEKIPEGAFLYSYDLESITTKDDDETEITAVGAHAFDMCGHLKSVEFFKENCPDLETIGDFAFARCVPNAAEYKDGKRTGLKRIEINDNVKSIGNNAFANDFLVTTADLGENLNVIKEGLLCCGNNKSITSITSKNVELQKVILNTGSGSTVTYDFTSSEPGFKAIRESYQGYSDSIYRLSSLNTVVISNNATSIGKSAFSGNSLLATVKSYNDTSNAIGVRIPGKVESIGEHAFSYCAKQSGSVRTENLEIEGITSVELPSSVESIGEYAFAYNRNLKEAKLPKNLKEIPAHCFDSCGYDDKYKDEEGNEHHYWKGDYPVKAKPESTGEGSGEGSGEGEGQQQEEQEEPYEPAYDGGLTVVDDLSNVETIGEAAFQNCYMLSKTTSAAGAAEPFKFGKKIDTIGKNAFAGTAIASASSLFDTKIEQLQDSTFNNCRFLSRVECPDSLKTIGNNVFSDCPKMSYINFPVYTSLSKSMFSLSAEVAKTVTNRKVDIVTTLGKYINTTYKVPIGLTTSLPAEAFAGGSNEKFWQVDPKDKSKTTEIPNDADPGDPKYFFTVKHSGNNYNITGGAVEVKGTACKVAATLDLDDISTTDSRLTADYPVDVTYVHADSMEFDSTKFKLSSGNLGLLGKDSEGKPVLYVNSTHAGKNIDLTIAANAYANEEEYGEWNKGLITDEPSWSVESGTSLEVKENDEDVTTNQTKETSSEKCIITAKFAVKSKGTSVIKASFKSPDEEFDPPALTMKVKVVDPISSISYTIDKLGENHKDPAKHTMKLGLEAGKKAKIDATAGYTTAEPAEDEDKDFLCFMSNKPDVVEVDNEGNLTAKEKGTATITVKSATGSVTKQIAVTVKGEDETVDPLFIDLKGPMTADEKSGLVYVGEDEKATYTADCYPKYADQDVVWSVTDTDAQSVSLEKKDGKAILTAVDANKSNIKLNAAAKNDSKVTGTLKIMTRQKATDLQFKDLQPVVIIAESTESKVYSFTMSNKQERTEGLVRIPDSTIDDVTFTSSNPEILALGTSQSSCTEESVVMTNTSTTGDSKPVYYKGLKKGTAKITAETQHGVKTTLDVMVISDPISSFDFTLDSIGDSAKNPAKLMMPKDQEDQISTDLTYTNDEEKDDFIRYSSENPDVVTVDKDGKIKAVGEGTTKVWISAASKKVSRSIEITVKDKREDVKPVLINQITGQETADKKNGLVFVGEQTIYKATCLPAYASQKVTWDVGTSQDVELEQIAGDDTSVEAKLTGINSNKSLTLRATATLISGSKSVTKSIVTRQKATELKFKETAPLIVIKDNTDSRLASLTMSNDANQLDGLVRFPSDTLDDVTFTCEDKDVLLLGTSMDKCAEEPVTLKTTSTSEKPKLYFNGIKKGTATIKAETPYGIKAELEVEVITDPIRLFDFTIDSIGDASKNPAKLWMPLDQEDQISTALTYTYNEDKDDFIRYRSENPDVVTVDKDGKIKAVGEGTTKVWISAASKKTSRSIEITVKADPNEVKPVVLEQITGPETADKKNGLVYVGEEATFKVKCLPEYACQTVTWDIGTSQDVSLKEIQGEGSSVDAELTGINPNKTVNLKATAELISGRKANSKSVVTRQKTTGLIFREDAPYIGANKAKSLKLSSSKTQKDGIVRVPETSMDDVTFTSSNPSVLLLGTSSGSCTERSVTISATSSSQTKYLYYKGLKTGVSTITATTASGVTAKINVEVVGQPITSLKCEESSLTLLKGAKTKMDVQKTPSASTEKVTYESSNTKVATVDANGNITAVGEGSARITVRSIINKKSASCTVTVPKAGQTVSTDSGTYKVNSDNTVTFSRAASGVKNLVIPNYAKISGSSYPVTKVDASACAGNTTVRKITVGNNVKTIGARAFSGCSSATTLIIGKKVRTIGSKACENNYKLKLVKIKSKVLKKVGKGAFRTAKKGIKFKCPKGKKKKYKKMLKKSGLPKKAKVR